MQQWTKQKIKQRKKSLLSWSLYSSVSGKCACTMGLPFSEPTSEVASHPKALTPFGSDISHLSANSSFLRPQHALPKPLQASSVPMVSTSLDSTSHTLKIFEEKLHLY
jgi:hypothetical protein